MAPGPLGPRESLPVMGVPMGGVCHSPAPVVASTPRTTFAIEGRIMTLCVVPSASVTPGRMRGCDSTPRASPMTGMVVMYLMPWALTLAWVSTVSCWFHPERWLSHARVRSGAMVDCAGADAAKARTESSAMWVFMEPPGGVDDPLVE